MKIKKYTELLHKQNAFSLIYTTLNAEPYIIDQWRKVERTYLHRIFFNIFSVLSHSIQNENIDIELSCNLHLTNKKPIIPIDPRVY